MSQLLRIFIICIASTTPLWAEVALPSGQTVTLQDMLIEDTAEPVARFRYIAPAISRQTGYLNYADVEADFQVLCRDHALQLLADQGIRPAQVIVSLSDRPVAFGVTLPEATQFFEAFRIEDQSCVWDMF
ncbi:DUF6497 family protein [Parasulfitobacter algicola]|uniref:Acetolactate synthase n=1 Tax=Parasulfitobacter algicola TaxID=2614809 RepID=A0ABX2J136_9RHOB|nr:DUF6497 family protein [Sulfitobacter algicola]NSX56528.1 acetolactate synthase [Sulfitobacter algicola]